MTVALDRLEVFGQALVELTDTELDAALVMVEQRRVSRSAAASIRDEYGRLTFEHDTDTGEG